MRYYFSILLITTTLILTGCSKNEERAQGYVEGEFTYLSSPLSGTLKELPVDRGAVLKTADFVFKLDPEPEQSMLQKAQEQLLETKAQYEQATSEHWLAEKTLKRNEELYTQKAVGEASLDSAKNAFEQAKSGLERAEKAVKAAAAELEQAKWGIAQKTIFSPQDGTIFDTYYRVGEVVPAGRPVASLLVPDETKIIFFVGEPILSKVNIGDSITISCDGCPKKPALMGKIYFISPENEYTPPVIFSTETRKKLIYRVEAYPSENNAVQLKPGQPVTVHLYDK